MTDKLYWKKYYIHFKTKREKMHERAGYITGARFEKMLDEIRVLQKLEDFCYKKIEECE